MARVNRTTGFFLIVGVVALVATISGARLMMNPNDELDKTEGGGAETGIFARGDVDSAGGLAVLVPTRPGKIVAINVKENDVVKSGAVLVQLDDTHERKQVEIAEKQLEVAKAALRAAREKITKEHEGKIIAQQNQVDRADSAHQLAQAMHKRALQAAEQKIDAGADSRLQEASIALEQAKKDRDSAKEGLAKLQSVDLKVVLSEQDEAVKKAVLEVNAAKSILDLCSIKAPSDGQVLEVNYQVGGSAPLPLGDANASRALVFRPEAALIVRAEIDQENALSVKPGQKVTLTFLAAKQNYTWTGSVDKVAGYIQRRRSRTTDPDTFNDSKTRECIIRVDANPKNPDMLPGMRLSVRIHTGQ